MAPLLPTDILAERQIRVKVSAQRIRNDGVGETEALAKSSLAGYAVIGSLRTKVSIGIEVTYLELVQDIWRDCVVCAKRKDVAISRRAGIFLLKVGSGEVPWVVAFAHVFGHIARKAQLKLSSQG